MNRRFFVTGSMAALLIVAIIPGVSDARSPQRFGRVHIDPTAAHLSRLPSRQRTGVIQLGVQLRGRPVAAYEGAARAAGRHLSMSRQSDVRAVLQRRQRSVAVRLRALGAAIEANFTDVFNGFRVAVRRNRVPAILRLPGVTNVLGVSQETPDNLNTVPFIGVDKTWGQTGFTGKGVKIAIIDSGINFYHLDFGGKGQAAWKADDGLKRGANFPTAKVVGGWDLAGDAYTGTATSVPQPDPNPLDCKAADAGLGQHGTHVAGTAAGEGVTADGKTYRGSYNAQTLGRTNFRIGPGVAPQASLMAFRVFGCNGGTYLTADAIEMAVRDGADVISMSLGGTFGSPDSLDAVASDNASLAGVVVVASAGNEGPSAYTLASPATSQRAIAVGAMDAEPTFPGATIKMATGADIRAIDANDGRLPVSGAEIHFRDNPKTPGNPDTGVGFEQSGCTAASFTYNHFKPGQIAVVQRGDCDRTDKAVQGQAAKAAAVVMVNDEPGLPPYESDITGVTIPFIGVDRSDDARFVNDNGKRITIDPTTDLIKNPTYRMMAPFTSSGPSRVNDAIKPDVTAPGVGVYSADGATTAYGKADTGTSMAAPAVAGVAALVVQAHPGWQPNAVKGAIVGTASATKIKGYDQVVSGAGVVQPRLAVDTHAYALTDPGSSSLTFGVQPAGQIPGSSLSFTSTRRFRLVNTGSTAITYTLSNSFSSPSLGLHVQISPRSVTVPAHDRRTIPATVSLSRTAAAKLPSGAPGHGPRIGTNALGWIGTLISDVQGTIRATPTHSAAGIYPLSVPWVVIPQGVANVLPVASGRSAWPGSGDIRRSTVRVVNYGLHKGIADVYSWGLTDRNEGMGSMDLRAAGVQTAPASTCDGAPHPSDRCLIFAVNVWGTWNTASENEIDVNIDINGDGKDDFAVISIDEGFVDDTIFGIPISLVVNLRTNAIVGAYDAGVGLNGSTVLLPVLASEIGLSAHGRTSFRYWAASYPAVDSDGSSRQADIMTTGASPHAGSATAMYDAFRPVLDNGQFVPLNPRAETRLHLTVDASRYRPAQRGQLGWMVVSLDDASGARQADLVPVGPLPK